MDAKSKLSIQLNLTNIINLQTTHVTGGTQATKMFIRYSVKLKL